MDGIFDKDPSTLEALAGLPRAELVERWCAFYKTAPPGGISRVLLVRAIAYELQAKQYGGLKPATLRRLQKVMQGDATGDKASAKQKTKLQPGTRLIREWNGITHMIEVIEEGFTWNGENHGSLSAIARAITGARWSGPRFFGLTSEPTP